MTDETAAPAADSNPAPIPADLDEQIKAVRAIRYVTEGKTRVDGEEVHEVLTGMVEDVHWGNAREWARGETREQAWAELLHTLRDDLAAAPNA